MDSKIEQYAIEHLKSALESGLNATLDQVIGQIELGNHYRADYYSTLSIGNQRLPLVVEVKGHITNLNQVKSVINFAKSFDGICMIVCEAIAPSLKVQFKELGIGFYEIGNELHLPLSLKVKNKSNVQSQESITRRLGFRTESSTKILFYFVCNPDSLNYTQREIAEKLGMSLGTINAAIKSLEKLGCIKVLSNSKKIIGGFDVVADRWRYQYLDVERNKLLIGRFSPINDSFYEDWKKLDMEMTSSYWGGECSASLVTDYLTPGAYTIYSYETRLGELLKNFRLKKDPYGKIEILNAFWPEDLNNSNMRIVPNFLTYCDLLNSENSRNKESASILKKMLLNDSWRNN